MTPPEQDDAGARVFDFFTSVPTPERIALEIRSWGTEPGYLEMFGRRWSTLLGLDPATIAAVAGLPAQDFVARASSMLAPELPDLARSLDLLRNAGIARAVVHRPLPVDVEVADDLTAELVSLAPDLLVGFARIDPGLGVDRAVRELRRSVTTLGMAGVTLTPFWAGIAADDPALAPVFTTASELGVPVWIHTSMHHRRQVPLEIEHPRHIDVLAGRYPELKIVCGHGGWPWVLELSAVAWRHRNVWIDVSAFRIRNVFQSGTGWDPLIIYGGKVISDRILFGTTWSLLGITPEQAVTEAASAPWPHEVRRRWLYENAARLLELEDDG
ncbi:MAG: amidohydrolase family protein [Nocardioides sp.]